MSPQAIAQATLAFTLANGFAIQLITLSVALVGLTVTFAKDFQQNNIPSRLLLIAIWVVFFVSIVCGIWTIKALITVVAPLKPTDTALAIGDPALGWATLQEYSFFIGLLLFIIQGGTAMWGRQPPTPP
jgi:hypothetical protein